VTRQSPGRKPRNLRILEGGETGKDAGKRPVLPVPAFERGVGAAPPAIADSPEALAEWERIVPGMERLELLKPEDRSAVVSYCLAWADYLDARRMYGEERSPRTWKIRVDADRTLHRWVRELGLSPSAESIFEKAVPDEGEDDNPFG